MKLSKTSLTLFFTKGVSLRTWEEIGGFNREIEIYKRLSQKLKKVNFVTYGGKQDKIYADKLGKIKLLAVKWNKNRAFVALNLLLRHFSEIKNTDVLKTNQIPGSEIPILFKKYLKKKLIVRCGYLYSYIMKKESKNKETINKAIQLEKNAFSSADIGIVSSLWQRNYVLKQYNIAPEKIKIIPNYVLTDVFKFQPNIEKKYDLVFVGRWGREKNIDNLLKALKYLKTKKKNISLLMIGGCCCKETRQLAKKNNLNIIFKGSIPNFKLPYFLNQAKVFILPSYYEGHPKVLLEGMSCGLACIGTDVMGIKQDIKHLMTGYLCQTDYKSIARAIEIVLSSPSLQKKLGRKARKYIVKNYDIDKILKMELDVIKEVINK